MPFPNRKPQRLKCFDYTSPGAYFLTICVKNKEKLLSEIIKTDDCKFENILTPMGHICDKYINSINIRNNNVYVDKYVIMPNHIHMLISLKESSNANDIHDVIRSFKTLVTKEIGHSIWQKSFNDHVIRGEFDYHSIWEYIDTNIIRWGNNL